MKEIKISVKRQKKEIKILLLCFVIAFVTNFVAIIVYDTQWKELFTHIGYVVVLSFSLYLIITVVRTVIALISRIIKFLRKEK